MRWVLQLVAMLGVVGALIVVCAPIRLAAVDPGGSPIRCGSVLRAAGSDGEHLGSRHHDGPGRRGPATTDHAGECAARISDRRWTAIFVVAAGVVVLLGTAKEALRHQAAVQL